MKEEIVRIQRDALARIAQASDRRGVEDARVAILGKKGELTLAQTCLLYTSPSPRDTR